MSDYTFWSTVLDHFRQPRNQGEIEKPDGIGESSETDVFARISLRVEEGRIVEARFQCTTCLVLIAACSLTTDLAQQSTLEDAHMITPSRVIELLGEVPPERQGRCRMAVDALQRAIQDYHQRLGQENLDRIRAETE